MCCTVDFIKHTDLGNQNVSRLNWLVFPKIEKQLVNVTFDKFIISRLLRVKSLMVIQEFNSDCCTGLLLRVIIFVKII